MFGLTYCRFSIIIVLFLQILPLQPQACDTSTHADLKEGNLGDVGIFPWLGVLRVHIHEGENFKVAVTGLALVKSKYGIINADDVAKVNPNRIKREGKAMFILKDNETWFSKIEGYTVHPEYEYATYNTIALVELDYEFNNELIPICWPEYRYNTSNQLYVLGYTDENKFLEKIMYKIEYINTDLCDEFYNRIGYKSSLYKPLNYHCGFAENNKKNCEWDNGMVLASNSTGPWIIIGFGIKGPGCAAPGRFIDISPYLPWIESSTDQVYS